MTELFELKIELAIGELAGAAIIDLFVTDELSDTSTGLIESVSMGRNVDNPVSSVLLFAWNL